MWFSVSVVPYLISAPATGAYTDQSRFVSVTYSDRDLVLIPPVLLGIPLDVWSFGPWPWPWIRLLQSRYNRGGCSGGCSSLHMKSGRVHGIGFGTGKVPQIAPIKWPRKKFEVSDNQWIRILKEQFFTGAAGAAFAGVHVQCVGSCDNRAKFENINKNKHLPFSLRLLGSNNR